MITTELVRFNELVEGDLYTGRPVEDWEQVTSVGVSYLVFIRSAFPAARWTGDEQTYRVTIGPSYGPPLSGWQPTREVNKSK